MPATTITSTRFHRAARDGLLDVVREASSKEANQKDEHGLSPVMWASFAGHSHVLRVLVSKGGEINKYDNLGNTALHLAAANANTKCVAFLCTMGADVWALNIDKRTPRDMAAAHARGESSLRLLDAVMAREMALDPKRCDLKCQRARQRAEKHLQAFQRLSSEEKRKQLDETRSLLERSTASSPEEDATSLGSSNASTTLSALWAVVRNTNKRRASAESSTTTSSVATRSFNFGVGSVASDGSRTIRPLSGLAPSTEVLYSGGALGPRRSSVQSTGSSMTTDSVTDAFDLAQRNQGGLVSIIATPSDSDPELDDDVSESGRRRSSLFDRPGFGSVAFRHSLTGLETETVATSDTPNANWIFKAPDVVDSAGKKDDVFVEDSLPLDDEEVSPLVSFLVAWGLRDLAHQLIPVFKDDLEALLVANDDDLQMAGIVTGPRKKLLRAIELHNQDINGDSAPEETRL
ncbi:pre-mRNA splicing regulator USH1G-like [Neocloeon triangulifer]|uniref:pre-mRNA splicing regulator USH1G-like n=1 Tax=Neocloeon triangulifer TaxID=2078957 RepID=UPI00286F7EB7|nr:pre-mRNA splicing regulator USH1G-like [Neocloeon triangulifer]